MDILFGIIIGLAVAWTVPARQHWEAIKAALRRLRTGIWTLLRAPFQRPAASGAPLPAAPTETAAPAPPAAAAATPAAATPSLSQRLSALESAFSPVLSSAPHSRDFYENDDFCAAVALLADPAVPLDTLIPYAIGSGWALTCVGLAALQKRPDREEALEQVLAHYDRLAPFAMYFALAYFQSLDERPAVGAPLLGAREWWTENTLITLVLRDYFTRSQELGDAAEFGPGLAAAPVTAHPHIIAVLDRVNHPVASALRQKLHEFQRANVDEAFLNSFGRFWSARKDADVLVEPEAWEDALEPAEATAREAPVRSLLVSGDPRVGKTAFLRLLAKRLASDGWSVFEASGADLMAGQKWFGDLEGRIQRTITELAVSKKLIWYVPDILQIAMSGTHQGQAASILDQILPAVSAGRLILWTEASTASAARLLRQSPTLRSTFEVIRIEPMTQDETAALAHGVMGRLAGEISVDAGCVEVALSSARQYLSASSLPGAVLDLIKLTVARTAKSMGKGKSHRVEPADVIITLSQLTGLPASILDNKERIDLSTIRDYFSARVIGQDEAVSAVVDRIAMLKAGLNDLGKPIGVMLFAGPTGTGKTEFAKTLAEFLFGSTDRLIRLDMSEFQTPEATVKILGNTDAASNADSLINRVRKQPFSVVLLDEFEKAHANVWDLFLQVFDDGRLTDALGHVADFRHCIIILTTNLGATTHRNSGLGFAPANEAFSNDQIMRAVGQTFRPEFQNRLDKVIVFRPLTRDLMRGILTKELARVLERRGLKDREWAVEWEASALEFLLEKGFSPEMGARPLKRAIDQYLIAPLAATIVERRFPEGDQFVFVRSDGRAIQAEFVDPDGEAPAAAPALDGVPAEGAPSLPAMILGAAGSPAELQALEAEYEGIAGTLASDAWEDLQAELSERMQAADFWTRADRHETLARLALMDRVKTAAGTARSLRARQAKGRQRAGGSSRELVTRQALQLHLVKEGIRDVFEAAPVEVALMLEPAMGKAGSSTQPALQWCAQLSDMYRAWAGNRHMQLTELAAVHARHPGWLVISGFGAHRLLEREAGLHVLECSEDERVTARVRVVVAPLGDLSTDRLRAALQAEAGRSAAPNAVVRRYRREPSPLVRDMNGSWRTGRLDAVLRGDFDLIAATQA